jgi:hypothetical protein
MCKSFLKINIRRNIMAGEESLDKKSDSKRLGALRRLPKEVMESLTKEEVRAFLEELSGE